MLFGTRNLTLEGLVLEIMKTFLPPAYSPCLRRADCGRGGVGRGLAEIRSGIISWQSLFWGVKGLFQIMGVPPALQHISPPQKDLLLRSGSPGPSGHVGVCGQFENAGEKLPQFGILGYKAGTASNAGCSLRKVRIWG